MTQPIRFTSPDGREVEYQPWSERDLDTMSQVSEDDQRRAATFWRRNLPVPLRSILDAVSRLTGAIHLIGEGS